MTSNGHPEAVGDRRADALGWAERSRTARHATRRRLAGAEVSLAQVLDAADADPFVAQIRILWLLESLPGARKTDTRRKLARLGIDSRAAAGSIVGDLRSTVIEQFGPVPTVMS